MKLVLTKICAIVSGPQQWVIWLAVHVIQTQLENARSKEMLSSACLKRRMDKKDYKQPTNKQNENDPIPEYELSSYAKNNIFYWS